MDTDSGGASPTAARGDWDGGQRDEVVDLRDDLGDRDIAAGIRDHAARQRDLAADQRDERAERRDDEANRRDQEVDVRVREGAASDRRHASQDRRSGASERSAAAHDRLMALADRWASTSDRENASLDGLTGVYLRGAGALELEREVARATRTGESLVAAFVDVDRLKTINDTRGHEAGDRSLQDVARTLQANLRPYDLVIRYGGDEFVCVLGGCGLTGAAKRFELVNVALADSPSGPSVTVGLAELRSGDSPAELVARADEDLYRTRRQRAVVSG